MTVNVHEDKFNGVVSLTITGTEDKETVKRVARQYFKDQYDHSPSKVVAEESEHSFGENRWDVMVADHSSGSLKGTTEYEV